MPDEDVVTPPFVAPPLALHPFRAWRLASERLGGAVTARSLGRPYDEVLPRLSRWRGTGQAGLEDEPALFVHEYSTGGLTVRGLVGALDLSRRATGDQRRVVHAHEAVHPDQVDELASRMLRMGLNPAPILLVHRGGGRLAATLRDRLSGAPDHESVDRGGQQHRIWDIRGDVLPEVAALLADSSAVIADGHHRYAAYLDLQRRRPGTGWDRGLAMLVDQDTTPLHLGAIHRHLSRVDLDRLAAAAAAVGGRLEVRARSGAMAALGHRTPAVHDGTRWGTLHLPVADGDLAVCFLHDRLLPALGRRHVARTYHHSAQDGLRHLRRHPGTLVLMPAPEYDVVAGYAERGTLLPEKATSFQPKPTVGVLMRAPDDD